MDTDQYQPIACAAYDIYEIAIMKGQLLDLRWKDEAGEHVELVKPLQLKVVNREEFLIFQPKDAVIKQPVKVRLDKIMSAELKRP